MKKINGHKASLDAPKAAGIPGKSPDQVSASPASKGPFSPLPPKDAKPPPRAARGDDDIMSEEPSVSERG